MNEEEPEIPVRYKRIEKEGHFVGGLTLQYYKDGEWVDVPVVLVVEEPSTSF